MEPRPIKTRRFRRVGPSRCDADSCCDSSFGATSAGGTLGGSAFWRDADAQLDVPIGRGINVAVADGFTRQLVSHGTFDTYADAQVRLPLSHSHLQPAAPGWLSPLLTVV